MNIDLTEAVQAAAEGFCADLNPRTTLSELSAIQRHVIREQALSYVTHAAPLIEDAVRAQIDQEIVTRLADLLDPATPGHLNIRDASSWVTGARWAAGVVRGEQR